MNVKEPKQRPILDIQANSFAIPILVSKFNSFITDRLLAGARDCLIAHGMPAEKIAVHFVPGSFELPQAAHLLAHRGGVDAIICLGAVIKGETPHFEYVSSETARGIMQVSLDHQLPVVFGVLTTDTVKQAEERSGGTHGHKGWDAALTALEMAAFSRSVRRSG